MRRLIENIARKIHRNTEEDIPFSTELISSEERDQMLLWYRSEKAQEEYFSKSITEKVEHMKTFFRLAKKYNFMSFFERGDTYLDEFSRLFVLLAEETKELSFSGYLGALSEGNPILKFYNDYFFRNAEENCLVDDLIGCVNEIKNDDDEQIKFLKRAIISIFYRSGERDQNLPFAFHVENRGFFSHTVGAVRRSTGFIGSPVDRNYDSKEILIGSSNGERKSYRFNEKPLVLFSCENRERKDSVLNDIVMHSLESPDFYKTRLIIFDSYSSFESLEKLPNLFWPIIKGSRRIDYMMEHLYRLTNARSEGRDLEKVEEIIVLFDDMVKLDATKLLVRIMKKSASAHIHFVYPMIEGRVPVSDMIQYADIIDVSDLKPSFSDEETKRLIQNYSCVLKKYDSAYYLCEESLNWTEHKHNKICDDSDPLFKSALRYAMEFETLSTSVLQKRFGIGYHRARDLIDAFEELGVLGQLDESGNRRILCTLDEDQIEEIDRIRKGAL